MMYRKEIEFAGRPLIVEIGRMARQAHGSVFLQFGQTAVLAAVVQSENQREGTDFFPLTVDYEEKMYAAGKIKGSRFIKREGRATDEAIITSRLIDRSIRPLFKETERRDTQVWVNVLAFDGEHDADVLGILATSIALSISGIAWNGPLASCRVVKVNGSIVFNPTYAERALSAADVIVSSRGDEAVMFDVEAKEATEQDIAELIVAGMEENKKLTAFVEGIVKELGVRPRYAEKVLSDEDVAKQTTIQQLKDKVAAIVAENFALVCGHTTKVAYRAGLAALVAKVDEEIKNDSAFDKDQRAQAPKFIESAMDAAMRARVLEKGLRIDGRGLDEIRPITVEVGVLPRVHGSGLFTRGETQALTVVTLGAPGDEQTIDSMEEDTTKRYMHHYNFPGFSVGETRPMRSPGRREIGHGALAEKALEPVIPSKEQFPYTIRLVSEILESNGSSSQAATCGSTLALMDAGVPIIRPVAGVAMGLISDLSNPSNYRIITDIQGLEDHSGDMDFKVAGTSVGVTAIQLDIKVGGIGVQVIKETLERAKEARMRILGSMTGVISTPRAELSASAPRIETLKIKPDKIRELIGPGGKMINSIIDKTGVQIDIEDDGTVFVTSSNAAGMIAAKELIAQVVTEAEVGKIYEGKVTRMMDFGMFVEILPRQEGLVHVSEMAWQRVEKPSDLFKVGDTVKVLLYEVDQQGRLNLSIKRMSTPPEGAQSAQPRNGNGGGRPNGFGRRPGGPGNGAPRRFSRPERSSAEPTERPPQGNDLNW